MGYRSDNNTGRKKGIATSSRHYTGVDHESPPFGFTGGLSGSVLCGLRMVEWEK